MQSIKEHNLKANHNGRACGRRAAESVCNLSKNTIWKQITTVPDVRADKLVLYAIYQRTQSESKSQHRVGSPSEARVCMQSIKEHNLKANHNFRLRQQCERVSVCNLSKNTIWKQITTATKALLDKGNLYAIYQRTQSESKSQLKPQTLPALQVCMQSIKEHNLKANHNSLWAINKELHSVCNLSKNTIWKQITTRWWC